MRALLDEQLSDEIAKLLRDRGHDVIAATERPELRARSDEEIMDFALAEGRAVVTNNVRDFRPIAASRLLEGRGHPGMILITARTRRSRNATGTVADGVERLMRAWPDGMADAEHWI